MADVRFSSYGYPGIDPATHSRQMFTTTNSLQFLDKGGALRVDMAHFIAGGIRISRVTSTGHRVDLTEDDNVTLLLPQAGHVRSRVVSQDLSVREGEAALFSPNSRRTVVERPQSGHFRALALLVPLSRIAHKGLSDALAIPGTNPQIRRLSAFVAFVADAFENSDPVLSMRSIGACEVLIEELFTDLLAALPNGQQVEGIKSALNKVRMAEEIMRARCEEELSMAEIAREVGVGLRSLQLAFQEARSATPREVLSHMRMDRVRAMLLAPGEDARVTTIAMACGFSHLGRFAQVYRETYGESPSETLTRVRRRQV